MKRVYSIVAMACAFLVWGAFLLYAQGQPISFEEQILTIFNTHGCTSHHTGPSVSLPLPEGLDLRTLEGVLVGSPRGPVVLPGDGENSPLVQALRGTLVRNGGQVPRMPFGGGPLDEDDIALIQDWIDQLEAVEEVINSLFAVTNSVVTLRGAGKDSFKISGLYNDGGAGLGLPGVEVTLALGSWSQAIPAGSFAQKGVKFVYTNKATGLSVTFNTKTKSFTVNATRQTLSGLTNPTTFSIQVGPLAGSQRVPIPGRFVGGKNRPLSAVFYVTKGTTKTGRTEGTDQFTFEGVLMGSSGVPAVSFVEVRVEFGLFAETIPSGSFKLKRGSQSLYEYVAPKGATGLTKVTIDANTGKFTIQAKGVDLSELENPAALKLKVGSVVGRTALFLSSAGTGFRYP